jgi:hypothetical protein
MNSQIHSLPKLVQIMVCQTWCAHPNNRTQYMVLNPLDWDNLPEPLIQTSEIVSNDSTTFSVRRYYSDMVKHNKDSDKLYELD